MSRGRSAPANLRQLRVGEELRHALARILQRAHLKDPDLADTAITVTEVDVSPDLKSATVFVTPFGGAEMTRVVAALNRASGYLRGFLASEITLRHTPRLVFQPDLTFEHAAKVSEILERPRVKQDLAVGRDLAAGRDRDAGDTPGDDGDGA